MFFFQGKGRKKLCVDATNSTHISRFINHSKKRRNLDPKPDTKSGKIIFIAKDKIKKGDELLFDYGDRRREVVKKFPWLKT
jgi:[histone H4]-lysine20 N-methyltransferase SETD8